MSARWYSKYEMEIKDKLLTEDNLLNATKYKEELKDVIDKESHRQNVDRAKKKSVVQRMDYDGFHQMVLGADLKGLKKSEITDLKPNASLLNTTFIQRDLAKASDSQFGYYAIDEIPENKPNINGIVEDDAFTISIFEKTFKSFKDPKLKIDYIMNLSEERFEFVMSKQLDVEVFLEVIKIIPAILLADISNQEVISVSNFYTPVFFRIQCFVKSPQMANLKKFISKKLKSEYNSLNEKIVEYLNEEGFSYWSTIHSIVTN